MKIILISGKAQHGKDTFAGYIKGTLETFGYKVAITHYADLLKDICSRYLGWNGLKDRDGRSLLQTAGADIRAKDPNFFVDHVVRMTKSVFCDMDFVIVPDTRYANEVTTWYELGYAVSWIDICRPHFDNGLTLLQKSHESEVGLDVLKTSKRYPVVYVTNSSTLQALKANARTLCLYKYLDS